ncbi:MAG: hypothetical protein IJA28_00335 [Coprobacter sp.]|nr:hypothetical protein [Coprobacter sp.]MBR3608693.1 hypothetical protein [Bacteroidales bacterium]
MLKKDYLLAQITELAKKFAYLIKRKSEGDDITLLADGYYRELNVSAEWLMNAECDDIMQRIGDWQLVELLVKMIIEDVRFEQNHAMIQKAQTLLFMVQELDRTYSFERIALEERIKDKLSVFS